MNLKIVFFITGMSAGGAERVVATLANALVARGLSVTVAILKGRESAYELDRRVKLVSANLSPGVKNLAKAISFYCRLITQERPNIVASFSTKSDLIALLSKLLFRTTGKLIVSDRADPNSRNRGMQLACNLFYPTADALVCQSESVGNYYQKKVAHHKIFVIANPLGEESIGNPGPKRRRPLVLSVGRLTKQKNQFLAIAAFSRLKRNFPGLKMKIFGSGPLEDDLLGMIQSADLEDDVSLEGIESNVIRKNQDASLFLFTSDYEGYPNALLEAAATGIPIVTTDFSPGTAHEIVTSGVNGYVVETGNKDAIVEASHKILCGELDVLELSATASHVRQRHGTEAILDAWLRLFQSLQGLKTDASDHKEASLRDSRRPHSEGS